MSLSITCLGNLKLNFLGSNRLLVTSITSRAESNIIRDLLVVR